MSRALYRCSSNDKAITGNFLSIDSSCESNGTAEAILGYVAISRGGEMLRALYRCRSRLGGRSHSLDLHCDLADGGPLGFVR